MSRIIIDVRSPLEYRMGHAQGAINIPTTKLMDEVPQQLQDTPKDTEMILYCASGGRSEAAIEILESHGFTNLVNGINQSHVEAKF